MKRKFPGLRKSFAGGYKELNDMDFFSILDEDLSRFSLIDRINLHFKIGASAMIPFSIEEQVFVARTDLAETFEEVLEIAVDVFEFSKQEKVEDIPPPAASKVKVKTTMTNNLSSKTKRVTLNQCLKQDQSKFFI